jgi:hypothetical protein
LKSGRKGPSFGLENTTAAKFAAVPEPICGDLACAGYAFGKRLIGAKYLALQRPVGKLFTLLEGGRR